MIEISGIAKIATACGISSSFAAQAIRDCTRMQHKKLMFEACGYSEEAINEWDYRVRRMAKETFCSLSEAIDKVDIFEM